MVAWRGSDAKLIPFDTMKPLGQPKQSLLDFVKRLLKRSGKGEVNYETVHADSQIQSDVTIPTFRPGLVYQGSPAATSKLACWCVRGNQENRLGWRSWPRAARS